MKKHPLFNNGDEITNYLPADHAINEEIFYSHFNDVVKDYIVPLIGQEMYDELIEQWTSGDSITDHNKLLLEEVRYAMANIGFYQALPFMDAKISASGGITVVQTTNEVPASQARVERLRKALWDRGYKGLDRMLQLVEADPSNYATYQASTAYTGGHTRLVNNVAEMGKYVTKMENRYMFRKMLPIIDRISESHIKGAIGPELYDDIITKITNREAIIYPELMPFLKSALSHFVMGDALLELSIRFDNDQLTLFNSSASTGQIDRRQPPSEERMEKLREQEHRIAAGQVACAMQALSAAPDLYPLWRDAQEDGTEEVEPTMDNSERTGVIGF